MGKWRSRPIVILVLLCIGLVLNQLSLLVHVMGEGEGKIVTQTPTSETSSLSKLKTQVKVVDGKPFLFHKTRPDLATLSLCNSSVTECGLNRTVLANTQVIDYAILGFAKCGTTTIGKALGALGQAPTGDTCVDVTEAIRSSYEGWSKQKLHGPIAPRKNQNILTGLKCPAGLEMRSIGETWSEYQPQTLFIVGIRHPVLAFESFYNMFIQNGWKFKDPRQLLPRCQNDTTCSSRGCPEEGVSGALCTDRLRYHVTLAKLGKTPLQGKERALLPLNPAETPLKPDHRVPNKIFLYEVDQLTDTNQSRCELFWKDLSALLELPFQIHPESVKTIKPGKKDLSDKKQQKRNQRKIDICDAKHDGIRKLLMMYARQAAQWICPYFLQDGNGVFVSSKEHFCRSIMERWKQDPCDKRDAPGDRGSV